MESLCEQILGDAMTHQTRCANKTDVLHVSLSLDE
jgi:hypothetical protein